MNKIPAQFMEKAKELYELKELERLGLTPDLVQRDYILRFMALLLKWNDLASLVSKKDEGNLFIRHFCDSLQPLLLFGFKKNARILDVGAGGGFPSIPTRIFRPDLDIVLAESNKKKAKFLSEIVEELVLENVFVFPGRVEALDPETKPFDYVVSRGVGTFAEIADMAKPFLSQPDGRIYTFKGKDFATELENITSTKASHARISEIAEYDLGKQIFGLKLVSLELLPT